jgi:hypothetical protein
MMEAGGYPVKIIGLNDISRESFFQGIQVGKTELVPYFILNVSSGIRREQCHLGKCGENAIPLHGDLWQPVLGKVDSETCPAKEPYHLVTNTNDISRKSISDKVIKNL